MTVERGAANAIGPSDRRSYQPDCAGCHANRYKPDPHKKTDNTRYTVLELKNCAGSCHIEGKLRSGQHRASAGNF